MIERCEKCGKSFMDKSEVNRNKVYEHIVPVSPFEESKEGAVMYETINPQRKETRNRNNSSNPEELQKSIVTTTSNIPTNVDTTNKGENNNSDSNYNSKGINITQSGSRGFRSIKM